MDITFAEPEDVAEVTRDNCFNSSDITFQDIYRTAPLNQSGSGAGQVVRARWVELVPLVVAMVVGLW